jgi:pimeloyl-ACP methyl ester carboxylesterase
MRSRHILLSLAVAMLIGCEARSPAGSSTGSSTGSSDVPAQERFTAPDGTAIEYLDWGGRGDAIVLLSGLGDTSYIWSDFAPRLVHSYRVLAITRRSSGGSGPAKSHDAGESAADVVALLNHIGVNKASLVGHSIAGDEMTAFAIAHPARTSALVYVDAAYDRKLVTQVARAVRSPLPAKRPTAADLQSLQAYLAYFQRGDAYPGVYYRRIWSEAVRKNFEHSVIVDAAGHVSPIMAPGELSAFMRAASVSSPNYGATRAPILAIYADPAEPAGLPIGATAALKRALQQYQQDVVVRCKNESVAQLRSARSDAEIVDIPGGLHHLFVQKPDAMARLISEFLKRHR